MNLKSVKKAMSLLLSTCLVFSIATTNLVSVVYADTTGITYYVSNTGLDTNNGTSSTTPWQSLAQVNATTFQPGDTILFQDGGVWNGTLYPKGSGTLAGGAITISDYGTGNKPLINGPASKTATSGVDTTAVYLYNQEYWTIKNLEITNSDPADLALSTDGPAYYSGALANRVRRGIFVLADDSCTVGDTSQTIPYDWKTAGSGLNAPGTIGVRNLSHIYFQNLNIHDVKGDDRFSGTGKGTGGIYIYVTTNNDTTALSARKPTKYGDVRIENCNIQDVGRTGISILSDWQINNPTSGLGRCSYWMSNALIQNNTLNRIGGDGIIVIGLDHPVIQYNAVSNANYANSRGASYTDAWSVGMFPFFTKGTTMQYNEIYNTRTQMDGEAIDVDGNNNGTVVQYNFTHDNEGGSFLVMVDSYVNSSGARNSTTVNTTIRYNVVQNDLKNVFVISNGISNIKAYNNTIYIGPNLSTGIIWQKQSGNSYNVNVPAVTNIAYTNNLIYNLGSGGYQINQTPADVASGTFGNAVTFENNWYFGKHPSSEPNETGKSSRTGDPGLKGLSFPTSSNPSSSSLITDLHSRINAVTQYQLKGSSPLVDAGIKVNDFGTTVVPGDPDGNLVFNGPILDYSTLTDFWGQSALKGTSPDIGAFESPVARTFDPMYGSIFSYGAEEGVSNAVADKSIISADSNVDSSKVNLSVVNSGDNSVNSKDGSKMLKLTTTGFVAGDAASVKLFNFLAPLYIPAIGNTYISFWLYAVDSNAKYVSIDGDYNKSTGGTDKLRNSSVLATANFTATTGHSNMPTGQWVQVSAKITDPNIIGGSLSNLSIRLEGSTGNTTCYIDDFRLTQNQVNPAAPVVSNVSIKNGVASVGSVSVALYTYSDANGELESGSTYQWYSSTSLNGPYTPITGATFDSYSPKVADVGKWIEFGVKPANSFDLGNAGVEVTSAPVQVVGFTGTAGFETGEFAPQNINASSMCFNNVVGAISSDVAHSGLNSYKVSGVSTDKSLPSDGIFFFEKLFDTAYTVTANTKLVYWIYPTNAQSAYTGVDIDFSSGTLRDSGMKDMNNAGVHPSAGHISSDGKPLPINQWSQVVIDLKGKVGTSIQNIKIMTSQSVGGVNLSAYFDDIALVETAVPDLAPVAHSVAINGTAAVYQTLTGVYTYRSAQGNSSADKEAGTTMQWSKSNDGVSNWTPITGATTIAYKLTAADQDKYIMYTVTPKNASFTGTSGSFTVGQVAVAVTTPTAPVASNLRITGDKRANSTLQGFYQYDDVNGDDEAGTTFRWLQGGSSTGPFTAISGAIGTSLTLTTAQANNYIVFEVTPANAATTLPVGNPTQTTAYGPCFGFSGTTGFEASDFSQSITQAGINGVTKPAGSVSSDITHSGTGAFKISGHGAGGQSLQFKVFDTNYTMNPNTVMTYWIYCTNDISRYIGVDLTTKSNSSGNGGPTLRDSGQRDINNATMHPNGGHKMGGTIDEVPLNQWVQIRSNIGGNGYLRGADNAVTTVNISFMTPTGTWIDGDFVAYIDDIQFANADVTSATDLVVKAEGSKLQADKSAALVAVNALSTSVEKTGLVARANAIVVAQVHDTAALSAEITTAQALYAGATEGIADGNYAVGSKVTFQTAITTAQAIVIDAGTIAQKDIDAAVTTLSSAVTTFNSGKVIIVVIPVVPPVIIPVAPTTVSNTDITAVVNAIKAISGISTITVDVTSNKEVAKDIFDVIKGTDKTVTFTQDGIQWSFNGKDVTGDTKAINMTVNVATLDSSTAPNKAAIADKVKNADVMVVSFANNGQLPGKATVKLKLDAKWLTSKDKNSIGIYYYNETTKQIETVVSGLKVDADGNVQFGITHNSDYIVSDKNLASSPVIVRLGGANRYDTSAKVSQSKWTISDYAVLATGDDFTDALCAAPFAKQINAPILLTSSGSLDASIAAELKRLKVKKVYIIGGTGAISQAVENAITGMNITIERISGKDRYETSLKIAQKMNSGSQVFLCIGTDFPDALSISSYAAATGSPILLTAKDETSADILKFISDNKSKVYVVGGTGVILDTVLSSVSGAERIFGLDRYATNVAVLSKFNSGFNFANIYFATGENYPDAICAAALAGASGAPIILINSNISTDEKAYIKSQLGKTNTVNILGGEGVISIDTVNKILN